MSVETIARRYGSALADVVLKSGETEVVKNELAQWAAMIQSSQALYDTICNPSITHLQKEDLIGSLIEKTRPSLAPTITAPPGASTGGVVAVTKGSFSSSAGGHPGIRSDEGSVRRRGR